MQKIKKISRTGFFFKNSGSVTFQVRWYPYFMQQIKKSYTRFWRKTPDKQANGQTDKTDRGYFIGTTLWESKKNSKKNPEKKVQKTPDKQINVQTETEKQIEGII